MREEVLSERAGIERVIELVVRRRKLVILQEESRRKVVEGREEFWRNRRGKFLSPGLAVGLQKVTLEIDAHGNLAGRARAVAKLEPAISLALLGQNAHHGP